jgi:hypothetical protein
MVLVQATGLTTHLLPTWEATAALQISGIFPSKVNPRLQLLTAALVGLLITTWAVKPVPQSFWIVCTTVRFPVAGVAADTVTIRLFVPVPPAFVALKVTVEVATVVGVPEITPLVALTVRPAGNPVAL